MRGDSEGGWWGGESQVRLAKRHSDHLQVRDTQSQGGWTPGGAQAGLPPHRGGASLRSWKVKTEMSVLLHQIYGEQVRICAIIGWFLVTIRLKHLNLINMNL